MWFKTAEGFAEFFKKINPENITIPDGVVSIASFAFNFIPELKAVTIPSSVRRIERFAFSECFNLKKIYFQNGIIHIGRHAFSGCRIEELIIPESVTHIGDFAFGCCDKLQRITIPQDLDISKMHIPETCEIIRIGKEKTIEANKGIVKTTSKKASKDKQTESIDDFLKQFL